MGLIYFDACLLIYLLEGEERRRRAVANAMGRSGTERFGISPLVKCECLVGPLKRGNPVLERAYIELFDRFANLDMPESVYLQAARIRGQFRVKTPDALHLACAQHHRCDALWTNDDRLARASHGLARDIAKAN